MGEGHPNLLPPGGKAYGPAHQIRWAASGNVMSLLSCMISLQARERWLATIVSVT
jgi:hypothetical protein